MKKIVFLSLCTFCLFGVTSNALASTNIVSNEKENIVHIDPNTDNNLYSSSGIARGSVPVGYDIYYDFTGYPPSKITYGSGNWSARLVHAVKVGHNTWRGYYKG